MKHLINELRDHLVGEGLVRTPSESGALPPCWLAPPGGIPAPGDTEADGADLLLGIYPAPGVPMDVMEQRWLVTEAADIYIRVAPSAQPSALELARTIRRAIADVRGITIGELRVEQCTEVRPPQLLDTDEAQGATYVVTYEFLIRDASFDG